MGYTIRCLRKARRSDSLERLASNLLTRRKDFSGGVPKLLDIAYTDRKDDVRIKKHIAPCGDLSLMAGCCEYMIGGYVMMVMVE